MNRIKTTLVFLLSMSLLGSFAQDASFIKQNNINYDLKLERERVAYKSKVVSKMNDFYNYLNIIGNPEMDKQLRAHSIKLTQKLFTHDVKTLNFLSNSREPVSLSIFLDHLLNTSEKVNFSITGINEGSDNFWKKSIYQLSVTKGRHNEKLTLNQLFTITSIDKQFGSTTKKVTTVLLGEVFE